MKQVQRSFQPWRWLSALALALTISPALAHKGSDAYLDVQQVAAAPGPGSEAGIAPAPSDFILGLSVALRDLDLVLPIDANADARVTWGEIKAATPQVLALLNATARLGMATDAAHTAPGSGACALAW